MSRFLYSVDIGLLCADRFQVLDKVKYMCICSACQYVFIVLLLPVLQLVHSTSSQPSANSMDVASVSRGVPVYSQQTAVSADQLCYSPLFNHLTVDT